jgi:type I restriction enzyme S subunit
MNAERLLAHYEKIADAPDAIARLRRFVLDLAVRGKLTDYEIKNNEVTTLGRVAEFVMGQAPPGNSYNEQGEGTVFVKVGEFGERFPERRAWTTQPLKFAREGDVLICVVGATIGKLNLGIDCAIGRSVAAIRPCAEVDQVFLFYSLMPFTLRLREDARGTAQGVISRPDLDKIEIWLPPLAEQRRIVAKVDALMALCDRLEAARASREAARDRLTAASLARLNAPAPETGADPAKVGTGFASGSATNKKFQDDARFALDALPALTARPDQIKRLRQTILNLAVRGKLVPQDPNDEPASELLKRIAREKTRLVKAGEIKKEKPLDPITIENQPFDLPQNWSWVRLDSLSRLITKGSSPKWQGVNNVNADEGILFITSENVGNHELRKLDDLKYVEMNRPGFAGGSNS